MVRLIIFASLPQNAYSLGMRIIHHTENLPKLVIITLVWLVCRSVNAKNLGSIEVWWINLQT